MGLCDTFSTIDSIIVRFPTQPPPSPAAPLSPGTIPVRILPSPDKSYSVQLPGQFNKCNSKFSWFKKLSESNCHLWKSFCRKLSRVGLSGGNCPATVLKHIANKIIRNGKETITRAFKYSLHLVVLL